MKEISELMSDAEQAYGVWRQVQYIKTGKAPAEWQHTQARTQGAWIQAARLDDMQKERKKG
jgi:hypothetical protein